MAELEIPDLPLITDLSLDDIIPAVQEGMAGHAQLSALLALMFSNIKVVENANGVSIRIPAIRRQICWGRTAIHQLNAGDGGGVRTATESHDFPQPFKSGTLPIVVGGPWNDVGNVSGCYTKAGSSSSFSFRLYAQSSGGGAVSFVAFGEY